MSDSNVILQEYLTRISYADALSLAAASYNFNVSITAIQSNVDIWKKRFEYKFDIKPTFNLSVDQWKQLFFLLNDMEKYNLDFEKYFLSKEYEVGYARVKDVQVLEFIQQEFGKPYKQLWLYKIALSALNNGNTELAKQIILKFKLKDLFLDKLYNYAESNKFDIVSFITEYRNLPQEVPSAKDNFLCTIENLMAFERSGKLGFERLVDSPDINIKMVAILVDWLTQVSKSFKLLPSTFCLCVSIFNAYASRKKDIKRGNLQLVGCSCLSLAAKYLEIYAPEVNDLVYTSDEAYSAENINSMEQDIFTTLGCNIALPEDMNYLRVISIFSGYSTESHNIAKYILSAILVRRPEVLPSVLCTAIGKIVSMLQNETFLNPFDIPESVIQICVNEILELLKKIETSTLVAHKKFVHLVNVYQILKNARQLKQFIVADRSRYADYEIKTYFKPNLEIYLLPTEEIPSKMIKLGEGSFGVVKKFDYKGKSYALKKMRDFFDEGLSSSFVREVSVLLSLNHPHVIQLQFVGKDLNRMAFNLGISDMKGWLTLYGQVSADLQVDIAFQLVSAVAYMHDMGCIHRDIKPQNVIVFDNGVGGYNFQLADLGSTRGPQTSLRNGIYTHKVCTLWYRPLELLFGSHSYTEELDVWSILCTLYECGSGNTLFVGGSEIDQIFKICSIMGVPTELSWPGVMSLPDYPEGMPVFKQKVNFFRNVPLLSECLVDLLEYGLVMDPAKRPRSRQLLEIINDYRV